MTEDEINNYAKKVVDGTTITDEEKLRYDEYIKIPANLTYIMKKVSDGLNDKEFFHENNSFKMK